MRIGDKVRLLKGKEEGYIVSMKGNIVEIEIEDGFTIPVILNEVVVIDKKEAEAFRKNEEPESIPAPPERRQNAIGEGIFLGVIVRENQWLFAIINQTDSDILFSISSIEKKNINGLFMGICHKFQAGHLGTLPFSPTRDIKLVIQIILHQDITKSKNLPIDLTITVVKSQLPPEVVVHALDEALSLIRLDGEQAFDFDPGQLAEQMTASPKAPVISKDTSPARDLTIDLHIDSANPGFNEREILQHQLELFEKTLDNALFKNVRSLKVIHGIGTGKLRNEIHKRLSVRNDVKYFEDADKERFGYGSTIIYF